MILRYLTTVLVMMFLGLVGIIAMVCVVGCGENPIVPDSVDLVKIAGCATDLEKIDGDYIVRADAACIDGLLGTPVEESNAQPEVLSIEGCEGPFGLDSGDETTYLKNNVHYNHYIGIVTSVNLERNANGSWYVHECKVWLGFGNEYDTAHTVRFSSPQPAQFEINEGDYIGFISGGGIWRWKNIREGLIGFQNCELYENVSTQSISCDVPLRNGVLKPSDTMEILPSKEDLVKITCLVLSVGLIKNPDPEPDSPDDYLIHTAVVKCVDGNLYIARFMSPVRIWNGNTFETINEYRPGQGTFGEGDVITLTQVRNLGPNGWYFDVYYEE